MSYPQYPQPVPAPVGSITRTYESDRDYQADAQAMMQAGWVVVAMASREKGLSTGALIGIFAAVVVAAVCAFCSFSFIGIGFIVGPAVLLTGIIIVLVLAYQPREEITATYAPRLQNS